LFKKNKIDDLTLEDLYAPNWQIFAFLSVLNFLITFWAHRLIFTKEIYYSLLSDQMEIVRIDEFVEVLERFSFLSMLLIPVVLLLKYIINTLILQLPLLLRNIEIPFKKMFRIVMLASIMLTLGQLLQYIWIYLTPLENITRELLTINPLSIAAVIGIENYPQSSVHILNQFNLFEILWGLCIYFGLLSTNQIKKTDAAMLIFTVWTVVLFLQYVLYFFVGKLQ
jgi:hypothetical protein